MGYNTVMVVLNDQLHIGAKDPDLGERILQAAQSWHGKRYWLDQHISARSGNCIGASYGQVISSEHADWVQVCLVGGNTGFQLQDPKLPEGFMNSLISQLDSLGYRVTKKRKKEARMRQRRFFILLGALFSLMAIAMLLSPTRPDHWFDIGGLIFLSAGFFGLAYEEKSDG